MQTTFTHLRKGRCPALCAAAMCACAIFPAAGSPVALSPADGATVPLLNAGQKAFLDMPREVRRVKFDEPEFRTNVANRCGSFPLPVRLAWTNDSPAPCSVRVACVPGGKAVRARPDGCFAAVCENLEVGRTYEWVVQCGGEAVTNRFTTEGRPPRLIRDPYVPNVRDIGGWRGLGGRRIRQGRIFRSAGLNANACTAYATREEVLASDVGGGIVRREAELKAELKRLAEPGASLPAVQIDVSGAWTCERADGRVESIVQDGRHGLCISGSQGERAVLRKRFFAGADGYAVLGCGADWFWKLSVNGVVEFDRTGGNNRSPVSADNFTVAVPVRKGENLIETELRSGSEGFSFYCRADLRDAAATAKIRRYSASKMRSALFLKPKGRRAGKSRINPENRELWLSELGVKSEIDLRSDHECHGMTGSPLGPSVAWFHYSGKCYEQFVGNREGREAFARTFRVLLDERNYPAVFHCIAGQDRTGSVSFVLLALLGADDDALFEDWEATAFYNPESSWFNHKGRFDAMWKAFEGYGFADMRDNVAAYVRECGFSDGDIARFRALMLED